MKRLILNLIILLMTLTALRYIASMNLFKESYNLKNEINIVAKDDTLTKIMGSKDYWLINLWETWCVPCKNEIPELNDIKEQINRNDIGFYAVTKSDSASISNFIKSNTPFSFDIISNKYIGDYIIDIAGLNTGKQYSYGIVPTTILIDYKNNKVLFSIQGYDKELLKELKNILNELPYKPNQ